MESTFSSSSLNLPHKQPLFFYHSNQRTKRSLVPKKFANAKQGKSTEDSDEGKSSVDENMIVLRMRIKRMKALEVTASKERVTQSSSSDSKEYDHEKKLSALRHENVYETIMELLQSYLLKTKPSVALGMLAMFAMCVPLSNPVAVDNVLKVVRGLLAGCHVCIDIHF